MKKEVIGILLVALLILMPFSNAQLTSIEIKDVNVNENQVQVLVQNNLNQDFNKETFIINNQQQIIKEEILSNFTTKFFVVNYQTGIKLNNIQVIINDNTASYLFLGNEDKFIIQQATTSTSEATQVQEINSPISYIYSAGRVAKIQDGNVVYFSSDNVGSTSIETDDIGNVNFKANYLPFGKKLSFFSIGKEKYQFASKEYDYESSLNYFNARYYNPSNGKFISNDPIFKPTEGGYQYVRNNPLTITDLSGKGYCPGCDMKYLSEDTRSVRFGEGDPGSIFETPKPYYVGKGSSIDEKIGWSIDTFTSIASIGAGNIPGIQENNIGTFYGARGKTPKLPQRYGRTSQGPINEPSTQAGLKAEAELVKLGFFKSQVASPRNPGEKTITPIYPIVIQQLKNLQSVSIMITVYKGENEGTYVKLNSPDQDINSFFQELMGKYPEETRIGLQLAPTSRGIEAKIYSRGETQEVLPIVSGVINRFFESGKGSSYRLGSQTNTNNPQPVYTSFGGATYKWGSDDGTHTGPGFVRE